MDARPLIRDRVCPRVNAQFLCLSSLSCMVYIIPSHLKFHLIPSWVHFVPQPHLALVPSTTAETKTAGTRNQSSCQLASRGTAVSVGLCMCATGRMFICAGFHHAGCTLSTVQY